jgi:hypothetical protein
VTDHDRLIELAGTAARGLPPEDIHELIAYLLWIAYFRRSSQQTQQLGIRLTGRDCYGSLTSSVTSTSKPRPRV